MLALAEELARLTGWPPAGAGLVSPTVPLTLLPPITSGRDRVMFPTQACEDDDDDGLIVMVAGIEFAEAAVMTAAVADDTGELETGTVAVVDPTTARVSPPGPGRNQRGYGDNLKIDWKDTRLCAGLRSVSAVDLV
jgi:hypothetical protein